MIKNRIFKRIGAGLMAGFCALSMLGSNLSGVITASAEAEKSASTSTENTAFPSVDAVVAKAATLLGAPYNFGKKGYSGIYRLGEYEALTTDFIYDQGIDCSGLVYYTMTQLGYKTSGFEFQNPVPVDTAHWLTVDDDCTITYKGVTSKVDVEKKNVSTKNHPYWECTDGSTITPGSVVIDDNPNSIDHAWIYMGEFDSRADVVAYLKRIGVPDSKITSKTVGDGKGDGGKHWRIESNGSQGVVINNETDGKSSTAMNMSAFRITVTDVTFEIDKYNTDGKLVGKSTVDNSSAVYGIYSDKACKNKVAELTIGANGKGTVSLPSATYYAKELKAPKGYDLDTTVYTITPGVNKVTEDFTYGKITINKTAEDGIIGDREFKVTWTENGTSKSKTAKTDSKGVATFSNLKVYDMSTGKAISYTVSEINVETRYVTPKAQNVTLTSGDADFTVTTKFENIKKKGNIRINKQSDDGDNGDRTFVITGGGQTYTIKTSSDGIAELIGIPVYDSNNNKITYTISEKNVPLKYVVPADQTATLTADETTTKTFENKLKRGKIKINKQAEDGDVGGRTFEISGNGQTYTVKTGSDGIALLEDLPVYDTNSNKITYTISEKNVPIKYVVPANQTTTLTADETVDVTFDNNLKKGSIKVNKQSEDNENGDREFVITGNGKSYTIKTGADGVAILKDIPVYDSKNEKITYTISEKNVPIKYVVPANQTTTLTADATVDVTFDNILKKFTVEVVKKDSETATAQGDATLAGAVYGLYKDGKLVDIYTTDSKGQFKTKEYVCGKYTLQEITPAEGYLLDKTVHNIGAEEKNYTVEHNVISMTVTEDVVKGSISIIKHTDDGSTQIETPEEGAQFEVYLKSAGSYAKAKASERDLLTCDEYGFAQTKDMPYGIYTVHQVKGWEGTEFIKDFDVIISENGKVYRYLINNAEFSSYVKIIKVDSETGKTIPYEGAGFELYDASGEKITMTVSYPTPVVMDVFYTNSDGYLITPEMLPYGEYSLVEVQAPYGYVLDKTPVKFTVTADNAEEENALTVVKVTKKNTAQKGKISVHKTGDIFSTVTSIGTAIWRDEDGTIHEAGYPTFDPHFATGDLEGAVFEVKAAEDIITADGTIRAKKGDVVAEITTDKNGYAETGLLYLGKYEIKEIKAPKGYVINTKSQFAELTYAGQEIKVRDAVNTSFENEYQGIKISLAKSMERDDKYGVGSSKDALRVEFGLYADEKIVAADGSAIPKDGLVSHVTIGEDMTATIADKIPFGKYYIKEISTDEKYVISGEKYAVTYEYAGQDIKTVEIDCGTFTNKLKRGSVKGYKVNEIDEPLAGAVFGIFNTECEVFNAENAIETVISDENGYFEIKGIPYGSYIVTEIEAPTGYVFSDEIYYVDIRENGDVVEINAVNKPITISISKQDIYGKELPGAQMQLIDSEGNVIDEWISLDTNHVVTGLPVGSYTLHEVAAPDGYVIATDIAFEVDKYNVVTIGGIVAEAYDNNGNPTIVMVDDTTKVSVSKTDITTGDELPGATLQIIDENGEIIDEWISTTEAHIIEGKLTAGKEYTLREEIAPDGYVLATDIIFVVSEDGSVDAVTMKDDTTKVHISKTDITGDKELEGAKLTIIDENGDVVEEWISTAEPHIIEGKLTAGKEYTLREEIAPDGYVLATDITFVVSEDGSVDVIIMKDDTTKVRISKRDITTDKELPGAKLIIIDEDGNILEEWISTSEPHYIEAKLIAGKSYTLREKTAPNGYEIANDIQFTVSEDGSVTEVVMYDKQKPSVSTPNNSNPKTGDETGKGVALPLILIAVCGVTMIATSVRKTKDND